MSNLDELITLTDAAAEFDVTYTTIHSWINVGRKVKNPGGSIHTRVCLQIERVKGKLRTTRRWVAEFIDKADIGKADVTTHIAKIQDEK